MKILGYTPAQVGWFLWHNGYALDEVAAGVRIATNQDGANWNVEMAKVPKQMTSCEALGDLPACDGDDSTSFTAEDAAEILGRYVYDITIYSCMDTNDAGCALLYDLLADPDVFGAAKAAEIMHTKYQAGFRNLGRYLMRVSGYTPQQAAGLLKEGPFNATAEELAVALRAGRFGSITVRDIYHVLQNVTGNDVESLQAMKQAGFTAYELIDVLIYDSGLNNATQTFHMLLDIGYSYGEAFDSAKRYWCEHERTGWEAVAISITQGNMTANILSGVVQKFMSNV